MSTLSYDVAKLECRRRFFVDYVLGLGASHRRAASREKYVIEFVRPAESDADGCVNRNGVEKLSCDPPGGYEITVSENKT